MKRKSIYNILAVLFLVSLFSVACTKKNSEVKLSPKLSTSQVLSVTSDSATVVGFVVAQGSGFSEKGVCYDTAASPTVDNNKVAYTGDNSTATYKVVLSGLHYATKYYARAYAVDANGPIYGEESSFTTLPVAPVLTTDSTDSITGNSAYAYGNVTVSGGATVTARGFCYGTSHNPTVSSSKTSNGDGTGAFFSKITGLMGNTTYYVRAYATNSAGTGYGPEISFKTMVDFPQVTTAPVTNVTKTSATSGGKVMYDGGGTVTERGLVWSTSANPTVSDNKIVDNGTDSSYVSNITGLTKNTTYHVRAYAVNSAGTSYGADISFTTLADITKFWVVGDYNGWDNSDNAKYIISTPTSNGEAEGYVWLKAGGIKLTTDHSWDNAHTFGDDGSGGLTNPGNNIAVAADGYYLIKANLSNMTYSLTPTTWGVIGDATPTGWGGQTDMVYDATSGTFHLGLHLTSGGSFKFRGTSDWNINYGSTAADGMTLNAGGDNIAVSITGDYYITLDLSHPNAYTYSANTWGLIGDATPGGWSTDTPMTWDATNQCMTATVDLVAGSYKFRANQAWTINLGGSTSDLTQDGGNLSITTAGNYTVQLFLSGTPHCVLTKN
jgi:hypothetical protein